MEFKLAICEKFNERIHGRDENSSLNIDKYIIVVDILDLNDFYSNYFYVQPRMKIEIIKMDELLPGREHVAYLNTFWLRIVQRCWKKTFRLRKELIKKRSTSNALRHRERTGQWAPALRHYPIFNLGLRGLRL
jgi:hypothetical protein